MNQWISSKQFNCKSFCEVEFSASMVNHRFTIIIIMPIKKKNQEDCCSPWFYHMKRAVKIFRFLTANLMYLSGFKILKYTVLKVNFSTLHMTKYHDSNFLLFYLFSLTTLISYQLTVTLSGLKTDQGVLVS